MTSSGGKVPQPVDVKKQFHLHDGKIIYRQPRRKPDNNDWFGCNFCNRWLESMSQFEEHYTREHGEAESYQFELLELKNCVIKLPYVLSSQSRISTLERDTDNLNLQLSALALSAKNNGGTEMVATTTSMKKAIRKAIKVTQIDKNGSSYKKIKTHLVNKTGMDEGKIDKRLRKLLERYVEFNKLERHYKRGKTLYSLPSHKKTFSLREGYKKLPQEETRRFRDQQLKLLAKSLRPHGEPF